MKIRLFAISCLATLTIGAIGYGRTAMGQTVDAKDRQEFLARSYPFIDQGQEPPGRYAPSEKLGGMLAWQGPSGWRTRHGPAVVRWSLGKASDVDNALYPDGSRGEARDTLDHGFRRRASGERLWIYGRIDIRPDDVAFIDADQQPVYRPPPQGEVPNLEADLARDPEFLAAMKDDRFALAVLKVFENRGFYKGQDPRAWICGLSQAAGLVANLRDRGESYHDYFSHAAPAGTYPDDRPGIERQLQSRIDEISKLLTKGPPLGVRVQDLNAWLGPGEHSAEEVRRAMEAIRPELEKRRSAEADAYREGQRAALEKAQRNLAAFRENHVNDDVFEAIRAHLRRLGWRTETEQDRERIHQDWVGRALQVLQEVKELEQRPAAPPEAWVAPLRGRSPGFGRSFAAGALEAMPADVRAVETGELDRRVRELALTGRVTEQEYRVLIKRSSRSL